MLLSCPHCSKQLAIADDKLPAGKRFKLNCPKCATPFTVSRDSDPTAANSQTGTLPPRASKPAYFAPGAKVALLLTRNPGWSTALSSCLRERGYQISAAAAEEEALSSLETIPFTIAFIDHGPETAGLVQAIHDWPGIRRRALNLVLIGEQAESLHPDVSLRNGVNWYLHRDDVQDAPRLVQSVIDGYEETYKIWREAAKAGSRPTG